MEDLIEKNMGLVLKVVNRFNPKTQADRDAYIQAGRIGLWKALLKFSKHGGSKFSPYAWNPIKWEIIKEIRSMAPKKDSVNISSQTEKANGRHRPKDGRDSPERGSFRTSKRCPSSDEIRRIPGGFGRSSA